MDGNRVRLGRALSRQSSPLIAEIDGRLTAIWPYGPGFAPHVLIVGTTGGGKSTLLRYMITDLIRTPGSKALSLADGKNAGSFLMFLDLPGVAGVANTIADTLLMLQGFYDDMEQRFKSLTKAKEAALKTRGRANYQLPGPSFLVIDEYMHWILSLGKLDRQQAISWLIRAGSVGREVNCRLIIATQRPDTKAAIEAGLPGPLKTNLRARIAVPGLMGLDGLEARMAFDETEVADRIPSRLGSGLIRVGTHEALFVVPWLADPTAPETSDADREAAWRLLPQPGL